MRRVVRPALPFGGLLLGTLCACAHGGSSSSSRDQPAPQTASRPNVVTAADIENNPGQSIEQILTSKFPGITAVRTPDGSLALRIRGGSSIEGSNTPLYVIDGVPVDPGPYGSLTGINLRDIETVEVLKDAVSTSMYGLRGANGVIIIKTKRPPPPQKEGA